MSDSILMYQQLEDIKNLLKQILEKENQMIVAVYFFGFWFLVLFFGVASKKF